MDQQLADRQKDLEAAEQKRQAFEAKNAETMPGTGSLINKIEGARAELRGVGIRSAGGAERAGLHPRPAFRHAADDHGARRTGRRARFAGAGAGRPWRDARPAALPTATPT